MKGITWSRDSHGLFDYESRHLTKKSMRTNSPANIIRKQNELLAVSLSAQKREELEAEQKPLLNILNQNGNLYRF